LFEKKKMLGESVWNKRAKARTKSERVEQELKGKFSPFSAFFFLFFYLRRKRC
jgi:hypothetical protein